MKLQLSNGSYKHPSIDVNPQDTINLYPVEGGPGGREGIVSLRTGGLSLLVDLVGLEIRCLITVGDYTYVVVDNRVIRFSINYGTLAVTQTALGTIDSTTGKVYAAANPTQIIFVDGTTTGYIYNQNTEVFAAIADSDFLGAGSVVFIDGYFICNRPGTGQFFASDLNDGTTWDPLDIATAESSPDSIACLASSKGELWIIGQESTEIWYDAANASGMPFSPREGLTIKVGCGASQSVCNINDTLIWLDNRGYIVQATVSNFVRNNNSGYDLPVISSEALTTEILSYFNRDNAIACTFNYRGHLMYQITFPTAKKTWVYDLNTKLWHQRAYYTEKDRFTYHHGQHYTQSGALHILGGIASGKLYLMSPEYYDDAGDPIHCVHTTTVNNNEFALIGVDAIETRCETGRATQSGAGSDPAISLQYSVDGGHTWSFSLPASLGEVGEYALPIRWNRLGYGREWIFRFTVVEPIAFSLISLSAYISETEL